MQHAAVLSSRACYKPFVSRPAPRSAFQLHGVRCFASSKPVKHHFSICTNKTCKKQGCQQVIQFAKDLALEEIEIETCGCLGICGNGPNMVVDPPGTQLSHVSSPAKFVEVLDLMCNIQVPANFLKATELRLQGNAEARGGDLKAAEGVYSQALDLDIPQGKHLLHANRAGVRLTLGDAAGALEDAQAAVKLAPPGFTTAYIRQFEALCALKRRQEASSALGMLAAEDRAFAKSKEYKLLLRQLQSL
ncbi:hypothetical protein ABBQ38_012794 [Trebouxia sp. C0009 RCD-2024]